MRSPRARLMVELRLRAEGDRTVLTLRHTGLPDERAAIMHREGWDLFTERLRLVVRGQDPGPLSGPPAEANL